MLIPDLTNVTLSSSSGAAPARRHAAAEFSSTSPRRSRAQPVAAAAPAPVAPADTDDRRRDARDRGTKLRQGKAIGLIVAGDLLLLLLGWFLLVSPQRSTAPSTAQAPRGSRGADRAAKAPVAHRRPRRSRSSPRSRPRTSTASRRRCRRRPTCRTCCSSSTRSRAPPASSCLDHLGRRTTPLPASTGISSSVTGDFYSLTDLLYRLRTLVAVHNGALDVSGRLFSVGSVGITPSGTGRTINATRFPHGFHVRRLRSRGRRYCGGARATDTTDTSTGATTTTTASTSADTAIGP